MGFMDKAKKLAEQAQEKLDEVQQNFNQGGSTPGQGAGARYDEHGRPVEDAPPAAAAPPPSGEPTPPPEPEAASATPEPPPPESGDADAAPDPFRPLQQ
jgi:hypothetical protein